MNSQVEAIEKGIKLDERNVAVCDEHIRKLKEKIPLETNSDVIMKLIKEKADWEVMKIMPGRWDLNWTVLFTPRISKQDIRFYIPCWIVLKVG